MENQQRVHIVAFQSISLGFECAMFLAGLIAQRDLPFGDMLDRYEL